MQFPEGIGSWLLGSLAVEISQFWERIGSCLLGSLATQIAQFLEGTGSLLLGATGKGNYTESGRKVCWSYLRNFWFERTVGKHKAYSWKLHNFWDEQSVDCQNDWLGKMHNFLREIGTCTKCMSNLSMKFPQLAEGVRSVASVQYFMGVIRGDYQVQLSRWPAWELIELLIGSATWKY